MLSSQVNCFSITVDHYAVKVIGLMSVYILYVCVQKKYVNWGPNLLRVLATDFFLKINSPSADRKSSD